MAKNKKRHRKLAKRRQAIKQRAWKAAESSLTTAGWLTQGRTVDYEMRHSMGILRARSREEAQNNDHVKHFLRLVKTNVVGRQGIAMQGRVKRRTDGQADDRTNSAIERAWQQWGKYGTPDVSGTRSWRSIQRDTVHNLALDGEAIWRRLDGWDNRFGFALQIMDPQLLDIDYNAELSDTRTVVMGVEVDEWRRPVAYHFLEDRKNVQSAQYQRDTARTRINASEIYHLYLPEFCYQTRGVPWMATALLRLHQLNGYEDAEVTAARVAASKMGFYEQEASAGGYVGDGEDKQGNPIQDARPGEFEILPEGWSFSQFDPQHPNTGYGDFVKSCLRAISSGLGVNYNSLANDLEGVNYTSLRHGMLVERDIWMMLQDWMVEAFCDRVYQDWITPALMRGAVLDATGRPLLTSRIDDMRAVAWQPRRWPWVDPLKESQAQESDYALRVRSLSDIIRDSGRDPDEVWEEIAAENRRMTDLGIDPPTIKKETGTENEQATNEE